ncbi:unnamed protein product [Didymodactylos carnosus]|uniref:Uncharacterized protein n=1 Tax=Didymodactylos carnosus TaxID=1234261 RepID=A0A8S3A5G5_9BILA|nr:unnamed protein product [Didymodactylos carnosus]
MVNNSEASPSDASATGNPDLLVVDFDNEGHDDVHNDFGYTVADENIIVDFYYLADFELLIGLNLAICDLRKIDD